MLETLEQVRTREPLPPRRLLPALPRDLETICLKCLEKEPGRRYPSAAALADDLGRFQRGEPILARAAPAWEKAWKWARRRPAVAALLAAVIVVTISGLTGVTLLWRQTAAALLIVKAERDEKEAALACETGRLGPKRLACERPGSGPSPPRRVPAGASRSRVALSPPRLPCVSVRAWSARSAREGFFLVVERRWAPPCLGRLARAPGLGPRDRARTLQHSRFKRPKDCGSRSIRTAMRFPCISRLSSAADQKGLVKAKTWDMETRGEVRSFTAPTFRYVHGLSGDSRRLALAGDKAITIIDLGSGTTLASVPYRLPPVVLTAALNADGRLLAWSTPAAVTVWDTALAKRAGPVLPQRGDHLAFSPDGACLAICRYESDRFRGATDIWDYRAGRKFITLRGHTNYVLWAAFSPNGRRLATASADTTVKVWELATGTRAGSRFAATSLRSRAWNLAPTARASPLAATTAASAFGTLGLTTKGRQWPHRNDHAQLFDAVHDGAIHGE